MYQINKIYLDFEKAKAVAARLLNLNCYYTARTAPDAPVVAARLLNLNCYYEDSGNHTTH